MIQQDVLPKTHFFLVFVFISPDLADGDQLVVSITMLPARVIVLMVRGAVWLILVIAVRAYP